MASSNLIHLIGGTNILILGRLSQCSGNHSTANRLKSYFEEKGYFCQLKNTYTLSSVEEFHGVLERQGIHCVIGIHALWAGEFLKNCPVPYSLIFGGTDLNEYSKKGSRLSTMTHAVQDASLNDDHNEQRLAFMETAVDRAVHLITFCSPMTRKAKSLWPLHVNKIIEVPQAVVTMAGSRCSEDIIEKFRLDKVKTKFFTLVAGIRAVKDPLYLVPVFTHWHQVGRRDAILLVIGPELDPIFSKQFHEMIDGTPGVIYVGSMTTLDTHFIIKNSFALVNTSLSEGMCMAILEAMQLGTPVLARNIPANSAIIDHGETGILFHSPEDFIDKAEELMRNLSLREKLVKNARQQIINNHNCEKEAKIYLQIIKELLEMADCWACPQQDEANYENGKLGDAQCPNAAAKVSISNVKKPTSKASDISKDWKHTVKKSEKGKSSSKSSCKVKS